MVKTTAIALEEYSLSLCAERYMEIYRNLSYMLANPREQQTSFGLITNGNEFLFLKSSPPPGRKYATSPLFSLLNPQNNLYDVLAILKHLGQISQM